MVSSATTMVSNDLVRFSGRTLGVAIFFHADGLKASGALVALRFS